MERIKNVILYSMKCLFFVVVRSAENKEWAKDTTKKKSVVEYKFRDACQMFFFFFASLLLYPSFEQSMDTWKKWINYTTAMHNRWSLKSLYYK